MRISSSRVLDSFTSILTRSQLACASAPHSRKPMRNELQMRDGDAGLRVKPEG
jgi:hypothetical protein